MNRLELSQDELRDRMVQYCRDNGVKYYKFAHDVNVPYYIISKWKNGRKELWLSSLLDVDNFLKGKGY